MKCPECGAYELHARGGARCNDNVRVNRLARDGFVRVLDQPLVTELAARMRMLREERVGGLTMGYVPSWAFTILAHYIPLSQRMRCYATFAITERERIDRVARVVNRASGNTQIKNAIAAATAADADLEFLETIVGGDA